MQVFVTGGTGTIGTAVVAELLEHGHDVIALARSARSERLLREAGAQVLPGDLGDLAVLSTGAARSDGVISLGFSRDYSSADALAQGVAQEHAAVTTLGRELVGSGRPLLTVSGTPWIPGRASTEADPLPTEGPVAGRARTVRALLALSTQGVRSTSVRLPRTVHDQGRGGFAGLLADAARRTGVAGYPGDGTQRWPAVHARDAAVLFRLALENAPAGTEWHAVADEGDPVRDIATVVGRRLGLPVRSVPDDTFGPFGPLFAMDQPATSSHTRDALGWRPTHPSLLTDLENLTP